MGHHNANLDPLGISCVNFDEAPVATGFQHVGEKCFLSPTAQQTAINEPVLCDCCFPPSLYLSLFLPLSLVLFFNPSSTPDTSSTITLPQHLNLLVLHFLFCRLFLPPSTSFSCGWFCVWLPFFFGGHLVSCRYVVTMWLSWTLLGSWMLIWIHAFPPTLLHHRINSVRNSECLPVFIWVAIIAFHDGL